MDKVLPKSERRFYLDGMTLRKEQRRIRSSNQGYIWREIQFLINRMLTKRTFYRSSFVKNVEKMKQHASELPFCSTLSLELLHWTYKLCFL